MKLIGTLLIAMLVLGGAQWASAVIDTDADLVPDAFDNCNLDPNGPAEGSNQVDTDQDGYGNACDPDYDNDINVTTADFAVFLAAFGGGGTITDHDGDGRTTAADFGIFLNFFGQTVGSSGLACAGLVPCVP